LCEDITQTPTTGTDLAIETPAKVGLNAVCELSKKRTRRVNGVLPSEARRVDSVGGVLGEWAAGQSHQQQGLGELWGAL